MYCFSFSFDLFLFCFLFLLEISPNLNKDSWSWGMLWTRWIEKWLKWERGRNLLLLWLQTIPAFKWCRLSSGSTYTYQRLPPVGFCWIKRLGALILVPLNHDTKPTQVISSINVNPPRQQWREPLCAYLVRWRIRPGIRPWTITPSDLSCPSISDYWTILFSFSEKNFQLRIRFNFVNFLAQPTFSHCPAVLDHLFLLAMHCFSLLYCSQSALQFRSSISDIIA